MFTVTKPRRSRKPQKPRVFQCRFVFGDDTYLVKPIMDAHPEVAIKAYRLTKETGDQAAYHVRLTPEGHAACDCKGHERWHHCKHVGMLVALGCLPATCQPAAK